MGHFRVHTYQPCCSQAGFAKPAESSLVQVRLAAPQGHEPPADGGDVLPRDSASQSPHAGLPQRPPSAEVRPSRRNILDRASASGTLAGYDAQSILSCNDDEFCERAVDVPARTEEILASSDHLGHGHLWRINNLEPGKRGCALHIHPVLNDMRILGISAFYHDSAAALIEDGRIVAAAQEERFTRKKHDSRYPRQAIAYCRAEGGTTLSDLDCVAFYDKPFLKFERLLETYLAFAPRGFRSFLQFAPLWMKQKLHLPRELARGLSHQYRKPYIFTVHHESHAASAFFPSPFDEAAILTLDGVGEWATASHGTGRGNRIQLTHELRFPHSLGLLYSAFTYFCGFRVNSGEYKLMGL